MIINIYKHRLNLTLIVNQSFCLFVSIWLPYKRKLCTNLFGYEIFLCLFIQLNFNSTDFGLPQTLNAANVIIRFGSPFNILLIFFICVAFGFRILHTLYFSQCEFKSNYRALPFHMQMQSDKINIKILSLYINIHFYIYHFVVYNLRTALLKYIKIIFNLRSK